MQFSFHTGEWAPALNARVDLAKYHSAAALLRNFYVDYRGGASSRYGTKYCLQAFKSATKVRLIPFQASFTVSYVLEFGDKYIRFFNNGAAILEATKNITAATQANPAVITSAAHGFSNGDWVYIASVGGMTQLNGKYYIVAGVTANTFQLHNLFNANINSTGYSAYTAGGTVQRVYTIASPYAAADLALLKYAQNANTLIICHPNYAPQVLTLNSAASWTIVPITFGATISAPQTPGATTTLAAGNVNYSYQITAVDANGQEGPPATTTLAALQDLRTTPGTNSITWTAPATGIPTSYNVYKAELRYTNAVPGGASYGFIGNCTGLTFVDSNIDSDFSQTPPISTNPFSGAGVSNITLTNAGTGYTSVPTVSIAAGAPTATAQAIMTFETVTVIGSGLGWGVGNLIPLPYGGIAQVTNVDFPGGHVTAIALLNPGSTTAIAGATFQNLGQPPVVSFSATWKILSISLLTPGAGYGGAPAVTISGGGGAAGAATTTLGASSAGNPSVPSFFQQRLVLAAPPGAVNRFYMSQPGSPYNFDLSNPIQADDAITGTLVANQLNTIKSMVSMSSGLIMLTDKAAWQINGGSAGAAVEPQSIIANSQSQNGAADLPIIVANFDMLYVQAKGSIVRDSTYNFYANIFTGTDISVLSSHLFFGFQIPEWAWAEEPFKLVWAIRNDGAALSLTFLKEQELIGWTHHDTLGLFQSVASITESTANGAVDAVYFVVQRTINGQSVQYIERMADRFISGLSTCWCVDAALQYNSTPATVFSGLDHLVGQTVTGLADGVVVPPQVVAANGSITLGAAASIVTLGLPFIPQLQTLALDLGEPTQQGRRKKITGVTVRVEDTLGLKIGQTFNSLVAMKDLVRGNVGSATNEVVSTLITADARTIIDPLWGVPGQYCIQQDSPLPATILGVIPEFTLGDTPK